MIFCDRFTIFFKKRMFHDWIRYFKSLFPLQLLNSLFIWNFYQIHSLFLASAVFSSNFDRAQCHHLHLPMLCLPVPVPRFLARLTTLPRSVGSQNPPRYTFIIKSSNQDVPKDVLLQVIIFTYRFKNKYHPATVLPRCKAWLRFIKIHLW